MTPLKQHIAHTYNGNVSKFAREKGVARQTVASWVDKNALWYDGRAWLPAGQNVRVDNR